MTGIIDIHHGPARVPQVCGGRDYRYRLSLPWNDGPVLAVVGLHPDAGAARRWDAGLWRLRKIANSWGYGGLTVANLNARIVSGPGKLVATGDPVGSDNDDHLRRVADEHDFVLLAWGEHADASRAGAVAATLWQRLAHRGGSLGVLGWTANGQPMAPMRGMTPPVWPCCLTAGAHPSLLDVDERWRKLLCATPTLAIHGAGGGRYA